MLRLAMPVLVEQTLIMLVGMVDTWLAGRFLGEDRHVTAIGLMAYVLWLLPSMFAAVAIGATAMVSRFVGSGDSGKAAHVMNQAMVVGAVLALFVTVAAYLFGDQFIHMMQLQADSAPLASRYLMILIPVIPAIMLEQVGIAALRGAGDTMSGFIAMAIVNIVNALVSVSLVIGIYPFPKLGWEGLAIGTASAHALGAAIVFGFLLWGRAGMRLRWSLLRPDGDLIRRLIRVGLPGGADVLAILFCHLGFLAIINRLGTEAAAAHSLGVRIESVAYLPGTAFQVAAATMVGQFLGAKDLRRATRGVWMACLVGGGVMVAAGLLMFFGGRGLTSIFLSDRQPATADMTVQLLRLVSFTMPSLALTMILTGALRGAGDTRWPLMITFVGLLGVRIPLAYVLAYNEFHLPFFSQPITGVYGAWCAMVIDLSLRSVLVLLRFLHGGWRKVDV